jgi:hypothetical protein
VVDRRLGRKDNERERADKTRPARWLAMHCNAPPDRVVFGRKRVHRIDRDRECLSGLEPCAGRELQVDLEQPLAVFKGLDRDRAVDETGGQIAVFGRTGSRPFTRPEMEALFLNRKGVPFKVSDEVDINAWRGPMLAEMAGKAPGARGMASSEACHSAGPKGMRPTGPRQPPRRRS